VTDTSSVNGWHIVNLILCWLWLPGLNLEIMALVVFFQVLVHVIIGFIDFFVIH